MRWQWSILSIRESKLKRWLLILIIIIVPLTAFAAMAFNTNRNHIEPMLWGITGMMILLGGLWAIMTKFSIGTRQFAGSNSVIYGIISFSLFRMSNAETFITSFPFFALMIALCSCLAFFRFKVTNYAFTVYFFATFCLMVLPLARPTINLKSIIFYPVFVKFRSWFDFLAFRATFRYDFGSHNQLLRSWLRLELVARYALAVSSSYYRGVK